MKKRALILSFAFSLLILVSMMFSANPAAATAAYEPSEIRPVGADRVNNLGRIIYGEFSAGTLQMGDMAYLRLPAGCIWTTAAAGSGYSVAAAAYQTTEEWNTTGVTSNAVKYGTSNYVEIPVVFSGNENGLFNGAVPMLQLTRISDREVMMEVIGEPDPSLECCLYIYANRVYVDGKDGDYISLEIDAPAGSGFDSGNGVYSRVECLDATLIYAGVPGQRIGTVMIHEAEADRFGEGDFLTLELPKGAVWQKLAEDSNRGLKVSGLPGEDGRAAKFRFSGESTAAADLALRGMEVKLEPRLTGDLKVTLSSSVSLAGDLAVAKMVSPAAVFTVGRAEFEVNGVSSAMDAAPYIKDGRTYLPVRYFAAAVGATGDNIIWNSADHSVIIAKNGRTVKLNIGSSIMYVNNTPVQMDAAPEIAAPGRTMLPLRWIAEALGYDVYWDGTAQKAFILGLSNN